VNLGAQITPRSQLIRGLVHQIEPAPSTDHFSLFNALLNVQKRSTNKAGHGEAPLIAATDPPTANLRILEQRAQYFRPAPGRAAEARTLPAMSIHRS
jgi:hypothetical protein